VSDDRVQADCDREEPERVVLSGLPFRRGQRVGVVMIAEEELNKPAAEELRQLLRETQQLPAAKAVSEDQIAEEIAVSRGA